MPWPIIVPIDCDASNFDSFAPCPSVRVAPMSADSAPQSRPGWGDPRVPFALLLTGYAAFGCAFWGFNRSVSQIVAAVIFGCALEMVLARLFHKPARRFPLSAYISSLSIGLLLNYAHSFSLLFFPVFCAIASKYVLTHRGAHVFNPSLFGVVAALVLGGNLYSAAPAYQWGHDAALPIFMVTAALALFIFRVKRAPLVSSFLVFYLIQSAARAFITRHHLPPATLLAGTFSAPSLYLFTFFMITDPKTSPQRPWAQVAWALGIVLIDLWLHLHRSLSTLFFALFLLSAARFAWLHIADLIRGQRIAIATPLQRTASLAAVASLVWALTASPWIRSSTTDDPGFHFVKADPASSGITSEYGGVLDQVDPRVQHVAKWLISIGDAAATADFDGDGLLDLFLTNPAKRPGDRCSLYRNLGSMRFERVPVPALDDLAHHPEIHGLPAGAVFADWDNDGDQDLFLSVGYGPCRALRNLLAETGNAEVVEATHDLGISGHSVSVAATFFDANLDGNLDLFVANAFSPWLREYDPPRPFNIFALPAPEFEGDRRMFRFMHEGWHDADNGGENVFYLGTPSGFVRQDAAAWGLDGTRWSLAVGTADLDFDGFPDLYVANDFGPDDCYLNLGGKGFVRMLGSGFGSVGRDTYKGMNVSIGDLSNRGAWDIYVSNVHAPLQAEGSLLWEVTPRAHPKPPSFRDSATSRGILNSSAFGWGAAMGDLNLDGWLDVVQANGMVDDKVDRRFATPRDYWYTAGQIMLSGPEIHGYADRWADLRGYEIFGSQSQRAYLNRGDRRPGSFTEVGRSVGLDIPTNARGVCLADLDNDGDLDLALTHQFENLTLYQNEVAPGRSWVGLSLSGGGRPVTRDATGTRAVARYTTGGKARQQMREVQTVNGFSAQGDRRLLFGFGAETPRDLRIEIHWPDGSQESVTSPELNRYHTIGFHPSLAHAR
ncbi:hypothetical protein BH23VER1_BH23VER1_22990 [soil metagenome]